MTVSNSWLLAVPVLLACSVARADAPSPPTPEQVDAARVLYREARELRRQGRLKEALDRALAAYRTASTPVTAIEASELLIESGRLVEARDLVRGVAQLPPSPRESEKGRDARQQAATIAGTLDGRIPKIAIAGRPSSVEVLLDGKPLAPTDAAAWQGVDPGAHTVVARTSERTCTTVNVTLVESEARTIDLHDVAVLCGVEAAPAPVAPLAEVTPAPTPAAAPTMDVAPAAATTETRGEPERGSSLRWVGVAVGAVGAVAIGVGGAVALSAKSSYDSVAPQCPAAGCYTSAYDTRQSARSQGDVATGVMVAGAAALAGGLLLFVLAPRASVSAHVALGPASARLVVPFD